ncbi:MAG: hypothetical protein F6J87_27960 [Spirulina sp. SIO3F2]|nr:hypothetical protein [Spirulina sp. SIO3F2]
MNKYYPPENLVEQSVTYTLEVNDALIVIENVPARVSVDTGEQLFAPEIVERVQNMILDTQQTPKRVMQVPVYSFS